MAPNGTTHVHIQCMTNVPPHLFYCHIRFRVTYIVVWDGALVDTICFGVVYLVQLLNTPRRIAMAYCKATNADRIMHYYRSYRSGNEGRRSSHRRFSTIYGRREEPSC